MRVVSTVNPDIAAVESGENNNAVVILRENIVESTRNGNVLYTYDEYRIYVPFRENLLENVQNNYGAWLQAAKNAEYTRLAEKVRAKRDALLKESDATMCLDRAGLKVPEGSTFSAWIGFLKAIGEILSGKWAIYRQQLRDIPQQPGFPFNVEFPKKPEDE